MPHETLPKRDPAMTTSQQSTLDWAFILSLVGGVLVLAGGLMMGPMMMMQGTWGWQMMGWNAGWTPAWWWGWALLMGAWGLLMGVLILVGAARIRADSEAGRTWGIVIIVAGALSFLGMGMGGFGVGAVSAITGGAMALTAPGSRRRRTGEAS